MVFPLFNGYSWEITDSSGLLTFSHYGMTSITMNSAEGSITAGKFIKQNGNSSQILLANGDTLATSTFVTGTPWTSMGYVTGTPWTTANTTGSAGSVTNSLTFSNAGAGAVSGSTYNGSAARIISYNSIGAAALAGSPTQAFSVQELCFGTDYNTGWLIKDFTNQLCFYMTGQVEKMTISNGAYVGSPNGYVYAQEFYRGSSRDLKYNINPYFESALDILNSTSIYTYQMKANDEFALGFIAEDTSKWLSGPNQKHHNFGNHLGMLTKAIQEEDSKIVELERKITILENEIKELKNGRN